MPSKLTKTIGHIKDARSIATFVGFIVVAVVEFYVKPAIIHEVTILQLRVDIEDLQTQKPYEKDPLKSEVLDARIVIKQNKIEALKD